MTKITPVNDIEVVRQKRNRTDSQKKNLDATKEGVVVNSFVKEPCVDLNDTYDSMIISSNVKLPKKLYEKESTKEKSILPISLIATGVMGSIAAMSTFIKRSSRLSLDADPAKKLPALTRNLSVNEETFQAIYQIAHSPNKKTVLAGIGVITIGSMGFMGKMFIDGFKDVWVKKKEANIQKNLQEKLIAVETQSFSGKIQIIRSMLSEKASEFNEYITYKPELPLAFKNFDSHLSFKGNKNKNNEPGNNLNYFILGGATLLAIAGFGYLSLKNLRKSKENIETFTQKTKNYLLERINKSTKETIEDDKPFIKKVLIAIDANPDSIKETLEKLNWEKSEKENFIADVILEAKKSTTIVDKAMGGDGTPKPAFYSHVNDYRAFFYNWLLDTKNDVFKNLFIGITGISAATYGGKAVGEAIKEVQVKKINAETELELQQRLVSTELRNFKAKKDAAINPLTEEFYTQIKRGKSKEELKTMAENILSEVKNGPPFVYS